MIDIRLLALRAAIPSRNPIKNRETRQAIMGLENRIRASTDMATAVADGQQKAEELRQEGIIELEDCPNPGGKVYAYNELTRSTALLVLPCNKRTCPVCSSRRARNLKQRVDYSNVVNAYTHLYTFTCVRRTDTEMNELKDAWTNYHFLADAFHKMTTVVRRKVGKFGYVASPEFGKTGRHIHLHLATDLDVEKDWLQERWQKAHPNGGFIDKDNKERLVEGLRHPVDYLVKYVCKLEGLPDPRLKLDMHKKKGYWNSRGAIVSIKKWKEERRNPYEHYFPWVRDEETGELRPARNMQARIEEIEHVKKASPYFRELSEEKKKEYQAIITDCEIELQRNMTTSEIIRIVRALNQKEMKDAED